jgi:hypothetical protein
LIKSYFFVLPTCEKPNISNDPVEEPEVQTSEEEPKVQIHLKENRPFPNVLMKNIRSGCFSLLWQFLRFCQHLPGKAEKLTPLIHSILQGIMITAPI